MALKLQPLGAIKVNHRPPSPLVDAAVSHLGILDILVNNAGIAIQGVMVGDPKLDANALDHQWHVDVLGLVAATPAASHKLTDGGRIIFIGSGFGTRITF